MKTLTRHLKLVLGTSLKILVANSKVSVTGGWIDKLLWKEYNDGSNDVGGNGDEGDENGSGDNNQDESTVCLLQ